MSKIIPFPQQCIRPTPRTACETSNTSLPNPPRTHGETEGTSLLVASIIAGAPGGQEQGPVLDVPRLVALILRTCRRLGRRPSRLSPILARDLEQHCELGNPTAILMRDWLCGVRPDIPSELAAAETSINRAGEG